jgi:hypothetical protein
MLPHSSSISSSDRLDAGRASFGRLGRARLRRRTLTVLGSTLLALVAMDLAVGIVARPPSDPTRQPNGLARYFGYGESIEGKLHRQIGPTLDKDAPILKAGWIGDLCGARPAGRDPMGVSIYGMSFSERVAAHLSELDPKLHVTSFGGPGAPANHSYACFLYRQKAGIDGNGTQVLGILAGSLRRTVTTSGLGTSFEQPQPFAYPRYVLRNGQLQQIDPPIADQQGLHTVLASRKAWRDFVAALARQDPFISPFLANHTLLDYSVTARMLRRAWGQRHIQGETDRLRGDGDMNGDPGMMPAVRAMVVDFAARTRAGGARPVVLLFEDRGYDGVLRRTIVPTLKANNIPYVLSGDIARATDAGIFLGDGHFLPSIDRKIAAAVLPIIEAGPTPRNN